MAFSMPWASQMQTILWISPWLSLWDLDRSIAYCYIQSRLYLHCPVQDRQPLKAQFEIPQNLKEQAEAQLAALGGATDQEHMAEMVKAPWDLHNLWKVFIIASEVETLLGCLVLMLQCAFDGSLSVYWIHDINIVHISCMQRMHTHDMRV